METSTQQKKLSIYKQKLAYYSSLIGGVGNNNGNPCPICYDGNMNSNVNATNKIKLSCGHKFHEYCIDNWTKTGHNTCPLCRAKINIPISSDERNRLMELANTKNSSDLLDWFLHLPTKYKNDYEFVLFIVKKNYHALPDVSEELRNNQTIVAEAISKDGFMLNFAHDNLKLNLNFIINTYKGNHQAKYDLYHDFNIIFEDFILPDGRVTFDGSTPEDDMHINKDELIEMIEFSEY